MEIVARSEYLLFIFLASVGVLQLVAARSGLKGLLFIRRPVLAYLLSLSAIAGSYWWFFFRDCRIDTVMRRSGLEGAQQFYFFCVGAFLALAFTLVASSLIGAVRARGHSMDNPGCKGLDALRETSPFEAVRRSLRSRERKWPK